MSYIEIEGDLIVLAKQGIFDVIGHGANCFCTMKRGIAPQMAEAFRCDKFKLEDETYRGDINKLGQVDFNIYSEGPLGFAMWGNIHSLDDAERLTWHKPTRHLAVVNMYTQYHWSTVDNQKPLDYDALSLCAKKLNHIFKGKHIGLPMIGAGLGGGDWDVIRGYLRSFITDCDITVVKYKP